MLYLHLHLADIFILINDFYIQRILKIWSIHRFVLLCRNRRISPFVSFGRLSRTFALKLKSEYLAWNKYQSYVTLTMRTTFNIDLVLTIWKSYKYHQYSVACRKYLSIIIMILLLSLYKTPFHRLVTSY